MSDFILDTRPTAKRFLLELVERMRWSGRLSYNIWETPSFRLAVTWNEPDNLWRPWERADGTIAVVAGFLALDEAEWTTAEREIIRDGRGGLSGAVVWRRYQQAGTMGWDDLSGNCAILLYDAAKQQLHLRSDPAGCFPVFVATADGHRVWSSHPDILAAAVDRSQKLDDVSLAEFVLASTVTPPWTYYNGIEGCEPGTVFSIRLPDGQLNKRSYFRIQYQPDPTITPDELAESLAFAWRQAVRRRTSKRLGQIAVALSGGLDSRLILGCIEDTSRIVAFTLYDAPNRELRTAQELAATAGIEFRPIQRNPDYYGEHAPAGVRISGGMGTFANNHFLGVLESLHQDHRSVLLTGCYCDYLLKGLPLNRRVRWWDGHELLAPYRHEFYFQRWYFDTPLARQVRQRWDASFPEKLRHAKDDLSLFQIEVLRTFPLYHEGDNQQRLVPQRLIGWSPPATDLEVLRVYRKIPSRLKLNRSLFLRFMQVLLADTRLIRVPDANIGVVVGAPAWQEAFFYQWLRVKRKLQALRQSLSTDGSWPNWNYYYRHSPALERHWSISAPEMEDLFLRVLGSKGLPQRPKDFSPDQRFLFVSMLTLKLWWHYRACSTGSPN